MISLPARHAVFRLSAAAPGRPVRIVAHDAGKGLSRRLRGLGLPVGADVEVVHGTGRGRMVIAHGHARLALDSSVSGVILVTPAAPTSVFGPEPPPAATGIGTT